MKKESLWILATSIIIIAGFLGGSYYVYDNIIDTDTIYEGIYIEEYSVGGMTKDQAIKHIKSKKTSDLAEKSMVLNYRDKEYKLTLDDLGFDYDYDDSVKWAYAKSRTGNPFTRFKEIKRMKKENIEIPLKFQARKGKIELEVDRIAEEINQDPVDAMISFNDGDFIISQEKLGVIIIKDELINIIENNTDDLNDIDIPVEEVNPEYTKEYYSKVNGVLGEFSTSFAGSGWGRVENIRLSSKAFDNLVIHPGQEVSYNEITGPKIAAYGYKEAPVILEGELVPGLGGGVCQTSTTLYNTLLLADLTITERSPHSLPPTYVNLGRDAAVSDGYLDLKFKNTFDYPIYMTSKIVGSRVYFYVYGDTKARDYSVKISEEVVDFKPLTRKEILDETMEPGTEEIVQEGRNGYKSKTYKSIIKDGKVVSSKLINSDYYRERQHIVKHGLRIPKDENDLEDEGNEEGPKEGEKPLDSQDGEKDDKDDKDDKEDKEDKVVEVEKTDGTEKTEEIGEDRED